jgi:hypothetical protein
MLVTTILYRGGVRGLHQDSRDTDHLSTIFYCAFLFSAILKLSWVGCQVAERRQHQRQKDSFALFPHHFFLLSPLSTLHSTGTVYF